MREVHKDSISLPKHVADLLLMREGLHVALLVVEEHRAEGAALLHPLVQRHEGHPELLLRQLRQARAISALLLVERERPRTEDLKSHTLQMEKTMSSLVAFLESTWNEDDCDTSERYEIV